MKHLLIILGFILCIYGCDDSFQKKKIWFNEVVNDIIENQIAIPEPVVLELVENRQDDSNGDPYFIRVSDLSLGGVVYWERSFFQDLYKKRLIDSLDVDFMFDQAKKSLICTIDTQKISKHTIHRKDLESLINKVGYDSTLTYLQRKYNSRSILFISNPIFSRNGEMILINVENYCGRLCGAETRFLYIRENRNWKLLLKDEYEIH